jgi:hypothetical protein
MKIGKLTLETVAPNAERLISSTGLSIAEMRSTLAGSVAAHILARAVNACLEEAMEVASLAQAIAEHGIEAVRAEALKLYEPKKEPSVAAKQPEEVRPSRPALGPSRRGIHAPAIASGDLEYRAGAWQGPDADHGAMRFARAFRRGMGLCVAELMKAYGDSTRKRGPRTWRRIRRRSPT